MKESNVNFIDDLLNAEGKFKTGEETFHSLNTTTTWLIEYKSVQKAIPITWKKRLKLGNMSTKVKKKQL